MKWLYLFIVCTLFIYINSFYKSKVFEWDVYGYSFYVSGLLPNNSILQPKHLDAIDTSSTYVPSYGVTKYGRSFVPNSENEVYKYTAGTAYFYAPFYFSGHLYNRLDTRKKYPSDGYSSPYSKSIIVGWYCYSLLGLFFLGKFLLRYFKVAVVLSALSIIAFTTNYWCYTSATFGFNHIPLFLMAALGLIFADNWAREGKGKDFYALSACLALSIVMRPSEIVLLALVPCILYWTKYHQKALSPFLKKRLHQLGIGLLIAFFIALPQFIYWYMATGSFKPFAYPGEDFDFSNPQIINGLFSYRKGWLVYSPLMVLAVLGFIPFYLKDKKLALWFYAYLSVNIYVIFSWWSWTYGGSLGARSMIQSMAFWALPLCFMLQAIIKGMQRLPKILCYMAYVLGIGVIVFFSQVQRIQIQQIKNGYMHWENMTENAYWKLFLNSNPSPELYDTLYKEEYY